MAVRIGIDGKVIFLRAGGIGRSASNLLRACLREAERSYPGMEFVIFTGPETSLDGLHGVNVRVSDRFRGVKSSLLRSLFCMPVGLRTERIDVFHGLDQLGIPLFTRGAKYVVTIHDVIPLILPQFVTLKHHLVVSSALWRVSRQADVVIAPSEVTREDIVRHLGVARDRIVVIPWGCEDRFRPVGDPERLEAVRKKYGLPSRYLLFVSTLEPKKNLVTLLRAFALLRASRPDHDLRLVAAGRKGWLYDDIFEAVDALGLREDVIFTGFVDDDDLPDLYRGALLFVFPSLYEGFGLPILEAMASGIPVIASNTSSIPEVAGDAAMLVDPRNPEAIAEGIARVLSDEGLRAELQRRGLARAKEFSWETVAQKTLDVYLALGAPGRGV